MSWESLRQGFLQLRDECAIDPPIKKAGALAALCTGAAEAKKWRLWFAVGKDINNVATRFELHAQNATARQGFHGPSAEVLAFWLDQLDEFDAFVKTTQQITPQLDGSFSVSEGGRIIYDVCFVSAEYCLKCEADEGRSRKGITATG